MHRRPGLVRPEGSRGERRRRARAAAARASALLEGDFTLRSGSALAGTSTSTASRRDPELLRELGERLAHATRGGRAGGRCGWPDRRSGPLLWPRRRPWRPELPFIIVRGETKEYGTGEPDRGATPAGRARVPRGGRRHIGWRALPRRCRPCARAGSWSVTPCASSTARRVAPTPSRDSACGSPRSTVRANCLQRGSRG